MLSFSGHYALCLELIALLKERGSEILIVRRVRVDQVRPVSLEAFEVDPAVELWDSMLDEMRQTVAVVPKLVTTHEDADDSDGLEDMQGLTAAGPAVALDDEFGGDANLRQALRELRDNEAAERDAMEVEAAGRREDPGGADDAGPGAAPHPVPRWDPRPRPGPGAAPHPGPGAAPVFSSIRASWSYYQRYIHYNVSACGRYHLVKNALGHTLRELQPIKRDPGPATKMIAVCMAPRHNRDPHQRCTRMRNWRSEGFESLSLPAWVLTKWLVDGHDASALEQHKDVNRYPRG